MALYGKLCLVVTVPFCDTVKAIIDRVTQVRCRPGCFAAADGSVIDHRYLSARSRQEIGSGESRDPAANYTDIGFHVTGRRLNVQSVLAGLPVRNISTLVAFPHYSPRSVRI